MSVNDTVSFKSTSGNKTRLFPSPFLIATGWFLILAQAFRHRYVVACSTVSRSATAKNKMDGYGTVPCLSKLT